MYRVLLLSSLFLSFIPQFPALADAGPGGGGNTKLTLDLETSALVVHGGEPGGRIAWFGLQHYVDPDFSVTRSTRSGIAPAAADGSARIDFDKPLADRAIWIAVDLKSGSFAAATPQGYRLNRLERDKTPSHGEPGQGAGEDGLADVRQQVEGLMVRPREGAWRFAGADGGGDDRDGRHDGRMLLGLSRFQPLTGSPAAPSKLRGDDLWFVIEPVAMDLSVLKGGIAQ